MTEIIHPPLSIAPPLGITVPARVVTVYDGDTIEVQRIVSHVRVRLLDCWSPEIRTRDEREKKRGFAARDYLRRILPEGSIVTVHIPATEHGRLDELITLGRILGYVFDPQGRNVSELQVQAGHATKHKRKERK